MAWVRHAISIFENINKAYHILIKLSKCTCWHNLLHLVEWILPIEKLILFKSGIYFPIHLCLSKTDTLINYLARGYFVGICFLQKWFTSLLQILNANCFRYNTTTGTFTVPEDGAGLYYFHVYLKFRAKQVAVFGLIKNVNGSWTQLCQISGNSSGRWPDYLSSECSTATELKEGNSRFI